MLKQFPRILACSANEPPPEKKRNIVKVDISFKYPFPWDLVCKFVKKKKLEPLWCSITIEQPEPDTYIYHFPTPWVSHFFLPSVFLWRDCLLIDPEKKTMIETGTNITMNAESPVYEVSKWSSSEDGKETLYEKNIEVDAMFLPDFVIYGVKSVYLAAWNDQRQKEVKELTEFVAKSSK